MEHVAGLITSEQQGEVEFLLNDQTVFNQGVKEVPVFYKLLGESRFRMVRNNNFELVFVHLTEDWMRQAKIDLKQVDCTNGLQVRFTWNAEENHLAVRPPQDAEYISIKAQQID